MVEEPLKADQTLPEAAPLKALSINTALGAAVAPEPKELQTIGAPLELSSTTLPIVVCPFPIQTFPSKSMLSALGAAIRAPPLAQLLELL